jgi:ferredoxin
MKLEAIGKPFRYRWPGGEVRLEPGRPVDLSPERAARLLAKAPGKVRVVDPASLALPSGSPQRVSLSPGWTVAFWDSNGKLQHGVIASADGSYVRLTSEKLIPLQAIKSAGASPGVADQHAEDTHSQQPDASAPLPDGYCTGCGGGYWIRATPAAPWQCGRCHPSAVRVDTLLVPGGTAPPLRPDQPSVPKQRDPDPERMQTEPGTGRPVFWESADGVIRQGTVMLFGRVGTDERATWWVGVEYDRDSFTWVRDDRLRNRAAYEAQQARTPQVNRDPDACLSCGSRRRWRSIHGVTICVVCHPPASPELVAEWIREA